MGCSSCIRDAERTERAEENSNKAQQSDQLNARTERWCNGGRKRKEINNHDHLFCRMAYWRIYGPPVYVPLRTAGWLSRRTLCYTNWILKTVYYNLYFLHAADLWWFIDDEFVYLLGLGRSLSFPLVRAFCGLVVRSTRIFATTTSIVRISDLFRSVCFF